MDVIDKKSPEIKDILKMAEDLHKKFMYYKEISKPLLNGELYLDNRDMTRLLKISERSLHDYRDRGVIPFYKVEGKILYKQSEILKLLEDNYFKSYTKEE